MKDIDKEKGLENASSGDVEGSVFQGEANMGSSAIDFQRSQWIELKKSINTHLNKLNTTNVKETVVAMFKLNLNRGRGLLVRAIMKISGSKVPSIPIYASLIAVLNSHIPEVGELLCNRLVLQFRKAYVRNDKRLCLSSSKFICQLVNQRVLDEVILLQILQMLLENFTNDSIEVSTAILLESGKFLEENSLIAMNMLMNKLREILHDSADLDKRTQRYITNVLDARRDKFRRHPTVQKELDLVEEDDQETHSIDLDEELMAQDELNIFVFDSQYDINEQKYEKTRQEILGSDDEEGTESSEDDDEDGESIKAEVMEIKDMTEKNLLEHQKSIYLTMMSSLSSTEAIHKLLKLNLNTEDKSQNSQVIADMVIKCSAQEKTYSKFFADIGAKLCSVNKRWHSIFVERFKHYYSIIHQFEANPLRNLGKFFGHLFASDKLSIDQSWDEIVLNEDNTNPAIRVFLKFVFQEMVEELGINELKDRIINDAYVKPRITGVFPVVNTTWDEAANLRFSINFFTAIGLGVLTEEMRDVLAGLRPPSDESRGRSRGIRSLSRSPASSRGSSRSYSRSSSGSYSRSRSGSYSRSRSGSYSRSRSASSRSVAPSRSPSRSPDR